MAEFASADFGVIDEAIYERTFAYQWQDAHAFEMVLSAAATPPADELSPEQDAGAAESAAEAGVSWKDAEFAATAELEP